ncbi:MAG: sugar transferase [Phycisphaerae bacterium]|nr:sugar transferase [Phycisphaerae bacterium]
MTIFPFIIDSRPAFLRGAEGRGSLLLMPFAGSTLLSWVQRQIRPVTTEAVSIVPSFAVDDRYLHALHSGASPIARVVAERSRSVIDQFEPSDLLLIVDPQCLILGNRELPAIAKQLGKLRAARYQVALDRGHKGAKEYLKFDSEGRLRRIQRYYEGHTWIQTQAVASALIPITSLWDVPDAPINDLPKLRRSLSAGGALGRDFPIECATADLTDEAGWLEANEYVLHEPESLGLGGSFRAIADDVWVSETATVADSARLYGPLIVQPGAIIERDAVVIGPTLIARDARVGQKATIAKCIVGPDALVEDGAVANQRVLLGTATGQCLPAHYDVNSDRPPALDWRRRPLTAEHGEVGSRRERYLTWKDRIDRVVAAFAILILSLPMLITAILVKLTSRGPIFFGHEREGLNGKPFKCWKFRTMVQDAAAQQRKLAQAAQNEVDGPQFKMAKDPRVTTLGHILRTTNIDELPQLFNVLRGEMSLIGPRPSPFRENQICVPWRMARLSVRPGISGLWQICRHDRESGDFHQWIYYDILYARHASFWLDLRILVATVFTGGGRFPVSLKWLLPNVSSAGIAPVTGSRFMADTEIAVAPLSQGAVGAPLRRI